MLITFDKYLDGIVIGFGLSFREKDLTIGVLFWIVTFKIK